MNRLPNAEQAQIDPRKLRDYALNPEHTSGQFKAAFFAQMGYTIGDWEQLANDIREQHLEQPAERGAASPYGIKFVITAYCADPTVRFAKLRQFGFFDQVMISQNW